MKRNEGLHRTKISLFVVPVALLTMVSTLLAEPVDFLPVNSLVNGPPYPTAALATDLVVSPTGTPQVIDRFSTSIKTFDPVGATDWFVADSFSFGVEREMKESGEKGGTADINIGVGELQECTISKSMDSSSARLAQFAINGNSLGTSEIYFVEVAGGDTMRVNLISEYTTPQPAVFTNVSMDLNPDGHSFDLSFSLLFSAPYDPQLPILNEVMTGDLLAIPEPASALILLGLCACLWRPRSTRPRPGPCKSAGER
jgi:Type VI secretion system effector, Hcp